MKTKSKTRRAPKRRAQKNYNEENIFNPFSPLFAWMKRAPRKKREYSEHPFRDSFITVVLLHVIAVLSFFAYGAITDATKSPTAHGRTEDQKDSRVARVLERQPELLQSEEAKPGEKLLPVREPNPLQAKGDAIFNDQVAGSEKVNRNRAATQEAVAAIDEPLPPIAPAAKAALRPQNSVAMGQTPGNDQVKDAFLVATGRMPRADKIATVSEPEIRRAEPLATIEPAPPSPERSSAPIPSEYTVQPGDNIFTISRRMNVSFTELAAANNLSSPRDVRVGQVLVSPLAGRDAM